MTIAPAVRTAPRHANLALGVVLLAVFMDMVDSTIVSIALPRVQNSLHAGYAAAQWMLAGYSLTFALVLITGGRIGDVFGRKRIFLIGVAGFTVTSALCGAAASPGMLIGARLAQGVSAALMVPQVMSVIMIMFDEQARYKAFAFYGAVLSLGNVSGPLLGGIIAQYDLLGLHWRAIFFVNVPVGLVTFAGAALFVPKSEPARALRVDLLGVGLISLVSFALMYPLIQGRDAGWPVWMVVLLAAAVPLLVLFCYAQRWRDHRDGSALVPAGLLRHRSFVVGLLMLLVLYTGLASLFLVLSYDLQQGLGWSPVKAALSWLGWPIGITLTSGVAQRFGATHGVRLIRTGLAVMTAGMLLLIALMTGAGAAVSWWQVAVPTLLMGLGMGLCVSILTNVVLAGVPPHSAGAGSGVTNAILQLGAAAGIAVVGMIFFGLTTGGAGAAADSVTPRFRQQLAAAGVPPGVQYEMTRMFQRCFQLRERSMTGTVMPPGCQLPDPRAEAALRSATSVAQADNSATATSTTLWYNAGVFVLAVALTPLLRPARRAEREPSKTVRP